VIGMDWNIFGNIVEDIGVGFFSVVLSGKGRKVYIVMPKVTMYMKKRKSKRTKLSVFFFLLYRLLSFVFLFSFVSVLRIRITALVLLSPLLPVLYSTCIYI